VEIICSPKASGGAYHPLRPDILPRITALKFILSKHQAAYAQLPDWVTGLPVWLQPMDEQDAQKNQENLDYALELAEQYGYKVSLQSHKLFDID